MADFLEVDNAEVFDGEMEEESINRLKVYSFDEDYFERLPNTQTHPISV